MVSGRGSVMSSPVMECSLSPTGSSPEAVAQGVAITDPLWFAVNGFVEGVGIVDTGTGEIFVVPPADPDSWHIPPRSN